MTLAAMTTRSRAINPAQKTSQKASFSKKITSKTSIKKITASMISKSQSVTKTRSTRRLAVLETLSRDVTPKASASEASIGTASSSVVEEVSRRHIVLR